MMNFSVDNGEPVNWAIIVYFHLVKQLIKWEKYD
jgi:hypothetical protein